MVWELWGWVRGALGSSGELWGCKIIEKINENQWFGSSGGLWEALGSSGELWGMVWELWGGSGKRWRVPVLQNH